MIPIRYEFRGYRIAQPPIMFPTDASSFLSFFFQPVIRIMAPVAPTAQPSLLERAQDWVAENRRAILVCTAAAAVALTAAYFVSSRGASSTDRSKPKDKRKDKSPSKKKKSVNDPDGPVLEEIKPKEEDQGKFFARQLYVLASADAQTDLAPLSLEEIAALSTEVSTPCPTTSHASSVVTLSPLHRTVSNERAHLSPVETRCTRPASLTRQSRCTQRLYACRQSRSPYSTVIELHVRYPLGSWGEWWMWLLVLTCLRRLHEHVTAAV